jgi:hypothetical protein
MKKISTLFKKDPNDLGLVINELNPENEWVLTNSRATRKWDGTACAVINGNIYKRYDVKKGKKVPIGAIPCQEPDTITGHWPHWVACSIFDNADKYFFEAFIPSQYPDGTYELCGPKVQGNPEKLDDHLLIPHGVYILPITDYSFEAIKKYLTENDIEGIVFHERRGDRMCKIRKSDFGIKR